MYRVYKFFENEVNLINVMKNIIIDFNIIKNVLMKIDFTKEYKSKNVNTITNKLNQIFEHELEFNERLFSLLDHFHY